MPVCSDCPAPTHTHKLVTQYWNSLFDTSATHPPSLALSSYSVWCRCKFKTRPRAFISIKLKTSLTSQIIFKKQQQQFRISFNQTALHLTLTWSIPPRSLQGDEETAVTPCKKKESDEKEGIKEAEERKEGECKSKKAKKNPEKTKGSKWNQSVCMCVCNLISQTLQGRQIYIILSHFPSAPHKPRKMGAIQ